MNQIIEKLTAAELVIWHSLFGEFPRGCDRQQRLIAIGLIDGLQSEFRKSA